MSNETTPPTDIVVKVTDQCTVRFPSLLPEDQRDGILAKMRGIPRHRARRAVNSERARAAAEQHGTAVLTAPAVEQPASARCMLRIYYRSMGDELLAFDAGPMTSHAADRMAHECTEAFSTDRYVLGQTPAVLYDARLVVLPSQSTETVQVTEAPAEATLHLVPDPEIAPIEISPVVAESPRAPYRPLRFYRDAMARRAARQARAA